MDNKQLLLKATAIGSLPNENPHEAVKFVFDNFEIPFWPQLSKVNRFEDMIFQYTQNMCGIEYDENNEKFVFNPDSETFYEKLEEFYIDYEEITENGNTDLLEKYAITEPFSSSIKIFSEYLRKTNPKYAKVHITGPFTWGISLTDKENKCAFYDDTLQDIVAKTAILKALWQIKMIKEATPNTIPIVFMDEPAMSQIGTSTFVTVKVDELISTLSQVVSEIKKAGALSAIHCCGKCNWDVLLKTGIDILNFDSYDYAKSLSLYPTELKEFLQNDGIIAWGVVPTLNKDDLAKIDVNDVEKVFDNAIAYLEEKGIQKKTILEHSIFTPSCGAGSLDIELAKKAMCLINEFSKKMQKKYSEI